MSFKQDLIKLGTTNPDLRPHIRQILAGCEKLPEGGMRDNCEKKKNEGGEDDDAKKEAGDKTSSINSWFANAKQILSDAGYRVVRKGDVSGSGMMWAVKGRHMITVQEAGLDGVPVAQITWGNKMTEGTKDDNVLWALVTELQKSKELPEDYNADDVMDGTRFAGAKTAGYINRLPMQYRLWADKVLAALSRTGDQERIRNTVFAFNVYLLSLVAPEQAVLVDRLLARFRRADDMEDDMPMGGSNVPLAQRGPPSGDWS